jgi:elongation factor Ts
MEIDMKTISDLRALTGAGVVDCKNALAEAHGDVAAAAEILRKKGIAKAEKKGERATKEGMVDSYIHMGGKVGVLVEVQCETDFVARTEQFKEFVHEVAIQVAAANPLYLDVAAVPPEVVEKEKSFATEEFAGSAKPKEIIEKIVMGKLEKYYMETCLLSQPWIKDEDKTVGELLKETVARTGENIQIKRFSRFALGE